jgi:hypothetical protein
MAIFFLSLIAACGSDDDDDSGNSAPALSGAPPAQVLEGESYSFAPTATDADGDTLTFTVGNAPPWLGLDADTGELFGTPGTADAGLTEDVVLSVSDGTETTTLTFDIEVLDAVSITLNGVVTDEPVADADVVATIGGETFATTADASGAYQLPVSLATAAVGRDALVEIRATGVDAQSQVELVTLVGSLDRLERAAGEDAVVDAGEDPRINVTHLSTARYLLAADRNGRQVPVTEEVLFDAEAAIPGDELLETAGLIKLIVDQGLLPVPEGETTLSVLQDPAGAATSREVIEALLAANALLGADGELLESVAQALTAAVEATRADPALAIRLTADDVLGTTLWMEAAAPDWLPQGSAVHLAADGTGVAYDAAVIGAPLADSPGEVQLPATALTWSVNEAGELVLEFASKTATFFIGPSGTALVEEYGFSETVGAFIDQAIADQRFTGVQIVITATTRSRRVAALAATPGRTLVESVDTIEYQIDETLLDLGWSAPLPRPEATVTGTSVVTNPATMASAVTPPAAGETWALPTIYEVIDPRVQGGADTGLGPDVYTLQADGTTSAGRLGQQVHDWRVDDTGILTLTSGDSTWTYQLVDQVGDLYLAAVAYAVDGQVRYRGGRWVVKANGDNALFAEDLPQALPLFWQAAYGLVPSRTYLDDGRPEPAAVFGYTFTADGRSARLNGAVPDCLSDDTVGCFAPGDAGLVWSWSEVPGPRIVRTLQASPAFTLRERSWEVLSYRRSDNRALMVEWAIIEFASGGAGPEVFIFPRINGHVLLDLSIWPEEYQDALDSGLAGELGL